MENQNPINPETPAEKKDSLLGQIIETANTETPSQDAGAEKSENGNGTQQIKKPVEPISFGMFMRFVGVIFLVAAIFFGSFLAYIVFNPAQASFFINVFGIDPNDIANLLKKLINGSFGVVIFSLSIVWIIAIFRAIWTPKDLKRKRLLSSLLAVLIGIILFSILSLWAFLFQTINATDYTNPEGSIILYNNDLYNKVGKGLPVNTETERLIQISQGTNILGPINILFDLRTNADLIEKRNAVTIESYTIDTNGGICSNGTSIVTGNDPKGDLSIICRFEDVKAYTIQGTYTVKKRTGETETVQMNIPSIEVRGIVDITYGKNISGQNIITLNAGKLKLLGTPKWYYVGTKNTTTNDAYTENVTDIPKYLCLSILSNRCDQIFILEDINNQDVTGKIIGEEDISDSLLYHLSITGSKLDPNRITRIDWIERDNQGSQNVICKGESFSCDYRFSGYGERKIRAVIYDATGKSINIDGIVNIQSPLKLSRNMKVMTDKGVILNTPDTYKADLRAYVLENTITPPADLILDARDITTSNDGYIIKEVTWKISNGKKTEEKIGDRITLSLNEALRYTIEGLYTFEKTDTKEIQMAKDVVIVDIEKKSLMPRIGISMNSDYAPSTVTIDASQSTSDAGEIKKFIFDFGEGKTPVEGDAIQTYTYNTAGDKKITVTVISQTGERAVTTKTIVLKEQNRSVNFLPSMTPGVTGTSVDFEANGTNGEVQEYIWNFGDNTQTERGYSVTHIFSQSGIYTVSLRVIYSDGTENTLSQKYSVLDENQ